MQLKKSTVGELKRALKGYSDDTEVRLDYDKEVGYFEIEEVNAETDEDNGKPICNLVSSSSL